MILALVLLLLTVSGILLHSRWACWEDCENGRWCVYYGCGEGIPVRVEGVIAP